jgi:hypothetical protein
MSSPQIHFKLMEFILECFEPSMFDIFLKSNCVEVLRAGCEYLTSRYPNFNKMESAFDRHCLSFISWNFVPFIQHLHTPAIYRFQDFISRNTRLKSRRLLRMLLAAEKFAMWVNFRDRTDSVLKLILDEIHEIHEIHAVHVVHPSIQL